MIDVVSETQRCSWDSACRLSIYEFLSTYSYKTTYDKLMADIQRQEVEKIRAKYKR